jgi:hypothetical protein
MSVAVVAASGRRVACQTPGASDRGQRPTHADGHEHGPAPADVDLANPSGHVDVVLEVGAATGVERSLSVLLPDPWRS